MKKDINLTPVITRKELELIERALHVLAARNYDLSQQESIFDGILLNSRLYHEIRNEANTCVELSSRLRNLYMEKIKLSKRRGSNKVKL